MSTETGSSEAQPQALAIQARVKQAYAQPSRDRDRLILDNLPMVRHIVQKVAAHLSGQADVDDLVSAGTLGLVRAAEHFDAGRGVEFSTYAYIRIRGAVIDELRGRSFVPSGVHNRIRRIQAAYQELVAATGRPPADEDLAARAGVTTRQFYRTLEEARNQQFLSIHGLTEDDPALPSFLPAAQTPTADEQLERQELIEALTSAIQTLPEKERMTVLLYYERDLTMKEAAEVLKITESRVSQLHASALFRLSEEMRRLR